MSATLVEVLVREIARLLAPINDVVENPDSLDRLLAQIGAITPVVDSDKLIAALGAVVHLKTRINELAALPAPSLDSTAALLEVSRQVFAAVRSLHDFGGPVSVLEGFGQDLADFLVEVYLARWHPLTRNVAALATLLEPAEELDPRPPVVHGDQLVRESYSLDRFHFDRLVSLVRDPASTLRREYGNSLVTVDDASAMAQKLFPRLLRVLRTLDVPCRYGFDPADKDLLGEAEPLLKHALIIYAEDALAGAPAEAGVVLTFSSADRGDLGLVVSPFGTLTSSRQAGRWAIELMFTAGVDVVAYGRHGLTLLANAETTEVAGRLSATLSAPSEGPAFIFGAPNGTRIEVGGARLCLDTTLSAARQSLALSADVSSSALVISSGDGDGFLSSILPANGMRANFDLGLAWSSERGLTLRGSTGLDATLLSVVSPCPPFI